jgi:hypothetical protein
LRITSTGEAEISGFPLISHHELMARELELAVLCAGLALSGRCDRLISALEAERGGNRVSEGVAGEDWAAVARVISDRVRELGWRQRELAERSRVSAAVVREIQLHTVERRRSPRTLESLSVALGWEPGRLDSVLKGSARRTESGGEVTADVAALWPRLDSIEGQLDEIVKLVSGLAADIAAVIDRVRDR